MGAIRVSIEGLTRRLDDLKERLNALYNLLEESEDDPDLDGSIIYRIENLLDDDDCLNLAVASDCLKDADKQLEVLDLITNKDIDLPMIRGNGSLEYYNERVSKDNRLTQEELDKLREHFHGK